jgi:hypothetical protein
MRRPAVPRVGGEEASPGSQFGGGAMEMPQKMRASDWRWEPEFNPSEFVDPHGMPDSGLYMQPVFMDRLLALRKLCRHPVVIHRNGGFSSRGHAENSAHYFGLAADFHVLQCPPSRLGRFIKSLNFSGVGFYEHWNCPGFHLDLAKRRARWVRTQSGEYVSLS